MWGNTKIGLRAYLTVVVRDRDRIIYGKRQRVRSFLSNWVKALYGLMTIRVDQSAVYVVNTGGVSREYPYLCAVSVPVFKVNSGEGDSSFGIKFGSGTTPPTVDDYNLESPIEHGTSSGQLYYYSTSVYYEVLSDRVKLYISRSANNQSGSPITVSEVGVIFNYSYNNAGVCLPTKVLILRDLIDPAITLDVGQTISVTYTLEFLL